jgi:hypothetical protein
MGVVVVLLEVTMVRTMLSAKVLMPFLMRLIEFPVQAAMLPLRHWALVHGLVHVT